MELFETGWQGVDVMRRCFYRDWPILSLKYSFRAFMVIANKVDEVLKRSGPKMVCLKVV